MSIGMSKLIVLAALIFVTISVTVGVQSVIEHDVKAQNIATNQTVDGTTTGEFMSIQNAKSGSISPINTTAYKLELNNISNETILLSDRPERIVETVSTSDFVGNWTSGPNSFAIDAPNDVLIAENTQTGKLETIIIASFNPVLDTTSNTLSYIIVVEDATTSINLLGEFGHSVLVIDGDHLPTGGITYIPWVGVLE